MNLWSTKKPQKKKKTEKNQLEDSSSDKEFSIPFEVDNL